MNRLCQTCAADLCISHLLREYCPTCNPFYGPSITLPLEQFMPIFEIKRGSGKDPNEFVWMCFDVTPPVLHPVYIEAARRAAAQWLASERSMLAKLASKTPTSSAPPPPASTEGSVLPSIGSLIHGLHTSQRYRVTAHGTTPLGGVDLTYFVAQDLGGEQHKYCFYASTEGTDWARVPELPAIRTGDFLIGLKNTVIEDNVYVVSCVDGKRLLLEGGSFLLRDGEGRTWRRCVRVGDVIRLGSNTRVLTVTQVDRIGFHTDNAGSFYHITEGSSWTRVPSTEVDLSGKPKFENTTAG